MAPAHSGRAQAATNLIAIKAYAGRVLNARVVEGQVVGAVAEGIDVIFVTGGIAARNFGDDAENPDSALLEDWLTDLELSATYGIGRLR